MIYPFFTKTLYKKYSFFSRKDNISQILSNKTFTDLQVDNVTFSTINGINKDDLIYKGSGLVTINGNWTFQNNVTVGNITILSYMLNDIDINLDLVFMDKEIEGKKFRYYTGLVQSTRTFDYLQSKGGFPSGGIQL